MNISFFFPYIIAKPKPKIRASVTYILSLISIKLGNNVMFEDKRINIFWNFEHGE